jgi:hypothetical protein
VQNSLHAATIVAKTGLNTGSALLSRNGEEKGTPRKRPSVSLADSAYARTWSKSLIGTALMCGSMRSMRSTAASTSSIARSSGLRRDQRESRVN